MDMMLIKILNYRIHKIQLIVILRMVQSVIQIMAKIAINKQEVTVRMIKQE